MIASTASNLAHISMPPPDSLLAIDISECRLAVELHRRLYGPVDYASGLSTDFLQGNYRDRRQDA
jgi:hypothetical protein